MKPVEYLDLIIIIIIEDRKKEKKNKPNFEYNPSDVCLNACFSINSISSDDR